MEVFGAVAITGIIVCPYKQRVPNVDWDAHTVTIWVVDNVRIGWGCGDSASLD